VALRRKKKAVHKSSGQDDKRLQNTLKRLGVNTIPGIEEVNIFKDDTVVHFTNPKVQASIAANTYVISGPSQTKSAHPPCATSPAALRCCVIPAALCPATLAFRDCGSCGASPARCVQSCKTCCLASSTSWAPIAFRT